MDRRSETENLPQGRMAERRPDQDRAADTGARDAADAERARRVEIDREERRSGGYGLRVMRTFFAVVIGLAFIAGAAALLNWNERRAVGEARALDMVRATLAEGNPAYADPANDGKLVHVTGILTSREPAADPAFGLSAPGRVIIKREVLMYQWQETRSQNVPVPAKSEGSEQSRSAYSYREVWAANPLDSSHFAVKALHQNPQMPMTTTVYTGAEPHVGAYGIGSGLLGQLGGLTPVSPAGALLPTGYHNEGEYLYVGTAPDEPAIGDLRVRFEAMQSGPVSVLMQQDGDQLVPFQGPDGHEYALMAKGEVSAAGLSARLAHTALQEVWGLRAAGFLLMLTGFALLFVPFVAIGFALPLLGSMAEAGLLAVAFSAAVTFGCVAIAAAWLPARPALAGALAVFGLAFGCFVWLWQRASYRKAVAAGKRAPRGPAIRLTAPPSAITPPSRRKWAQEKPL